MDGILVVDKDKDWTSHDVCAFIRSRFKIQKVGHAGTLDPLATGVLIVLLGRATRLFDSFSASDKHYDGTMCLGIKTDSHDLQGKITGEGDWRRVTADQIEAAMSVFRGQIGQKPPMISALKHKGVRLYKLARQGKEVDRPTRMITVHQLIMKDIRMPEVDFFAHVSKGTYLRTLVHEIGEHLGCFGALGKLRRLRCGEFSLDDAVTLPELKTMDVHQLGRWVRMGSLSYASR